MNKRILLALVSLFVFTCSAFGYSNPRWFSMPITVYMPNTSQSVAVTNAFKAWQNGSSSTVRFSFRSSANLKSLSDISVTFVDNASNPYTVTQKTTVFDTTRKDGGSKYFYKIDLVIAKANLSGKLYSQSELYSIALRAVGESLGIPKSAVNGVMSSNADFSKTSLTGEDLRLLDGVYKK